MRTLEEVLKDLESNFMNIDLMIIEDLTVTRDSIIKMVRRDLTIRTERNLMERKIMENKPTKETLQQ